MPPDSALESREGHSFCVPYVLEANKSSTPHRLCFVVSVACFLTRLVLSPLVLLLAVRLLTYFFVFLGAPSDR